MNALPHLVIANNLWARLGWPESARGHLAVGAVAPDAYRLVPKMSYRATHFRSARKVGLRRADFLSDFLRPALLEGGVDERALWIGWLSHIIADQLWRRTIRAELPEFWQMTVVGSGAECRRLRAEFQACCDRADQQLCLVPGSPVSELRWILRSWLPRYEVPLLGQVILRQWVARVTAQAMPPPAPETQGPDWISYPFVARAIEAAEEETAALVELELKRASEAPVAEGDSGVFERP